MNPRTILLTSILGVVCGVLSLLLFRQKIWGCCSVSLFLPTFCLLGSGLAPLFFTSLPGKGGILLSGAAHGLTVSALAAVAVWFSLGFLTSDETIHDVASSIHEDLKERMREVNELAAEKNPDQVDPKRKEQQRFVEQHLENQEKLVNDPQQVRRIVIFMFIFFSLFPAPLIGLLGGYLGCSIFRRRLEKRQDRDDDGERTRMDIPEQPKGWWEK